MQAVSAQRLRAPVPLEVLKRVETVLDDRIPAQQDACAARSVACATGFRPGRYAARSQRCAVRGGTRAAGRPRTWAWCSRCPACAQGASARKLWWNRRRACGGRTLFS
jgi:hypothetical protein